jgi:hypothetical protein
MATVTPEPRLDLDALDALDADAVRRLGELREQRQRLSIAALSDPKIAASSKTLRVRCARANARSGAPSRRSVRGRRGLATTRRGSG